jgi:lysozyme
METNSNGKTPKRPTARKAPVRNSDAPKASTATSREQADQAADSRGQATGTAASQPSKCRATARKAGSNRKAARPAATREAGATRTAASRRKSARSATARAAGSTRPAASRRQGNRTSHAGTSGNATSTLDSIKALLTQKNTLYIIIAVILLAALGIGACNAMSNWLNTPAKKNTRSATSEVYESPYDFAGFTYDANGRLTYSENGIVMSKTGIDVSEYQGDIDWQAVAGDGISFAFVRVGSRGNTDGLLYVDSCFDQNIDGAAAARLQVGTYFYSQAVTIEEAQEEADLVLSELAGRRLDLPVVFDYELDLGSYTRAGSVDTETLTQIALAFCKRIEAAGYKTMIYGNSSDVSRFNLDELGNRAIWYAEYDDATPNAQFDFAIWQYTSSGVVEGIDAAVDMDMLVAGMM